MPSRLISFKNNESENKLLQEVDKAYDKSAFVKGCIEFYLANKDKKINIDAMDNIDTVGSIDDWDF